MRKDEEMQIENTDDQLALCMQSQKFVQFTPADVGLILNKLYEDEAVFSFGWMWDSGFDYFIINEYIHGGYDIHHRLKYAEDLKPLPDRLVDFFYNHYGNNNFWHKIENAFSIIAYSYVVLYPGSNFVNFYTERDWYTDPTLGTK